LVGGGDVGLDDPAKLGKLAEGLGRYGGGAGGGLGVAGEAQAFLDLGE